MLGNEHWNIGQPLSRQLLPSPRAQGKGMSWQQRMGSATLPLHLVRASAENPGSELSGAPRPALRTWLPAREGWSTGTRRDKGIAVLQLLTDVSLRCLVQTLHHQGPSPGFGVCCPSQRTCVCKSHLPLVYTPGNDCELQGRERVQ